MVAVTFTALTLIVGEPFYERIWRAVELDLGQAVPDEDYGFWRSVGDGLSLVARGAVIAVVAGLLGLIPVVGGVLGTIFGVAFTGWLLADELSSRALAARGPTARLVPALPPGQPRPRPGIRRRDAAVLPRAPGCRRDDAGGGGRVDRPCQGPDRSPPRHSSPAG